MTLTLDSNTVVSLYILGSHSKSVVGPVSCANTKELNIKHNTLETWYLAKALAPTMYQ